MTNELSTEVVVYLLISGVILTKAAGPTRRELALALAKCVARLAMLSRRTWRRMDLSDGAIALIHVFYGYWLYQVGSHLG